MCTSSVTMTAFSLHHWTNTISAAAKKMLNNSGNSTHRCRSLCSTSNSFEQTPSSGCTRAFISLEWLDESYHRYFDASEYLRREGAVNGVVRLLEVYEANQERHSCCLLPNFLHLAHYKHYVRGRAIRSKPALLPRYPPFTGLTVSANSPNYFVIFLFFLLFLLLYRV